MKAWLREIDERVATGVARRRSVDDPEGMATVVQQENHSRRWSEGFQRRRQSDDRSGKKLRSHEG